MRSGTAGDAATATIGGVLPGVVRIYNGGRGAGAGFFWSPEDRLVLTNHHVVASGPRRGGKATVTLTDDRRFEAEVLGSSHRLDLAMLRLEGVAAGELPPAPPVGDSDALRVGELVFAVGNPWGRRGAVTAGIVSGTGAFEAPYVRSDAYLASGNSGGPLVNARGEVVGVNAMIFGGLALAIPSNLADLWASNGMRSNRSDLPRLGVAVRPAPLPEALRERADQETGLVISGLRPGGPAGDPCAGLLVGDVLLGVKGEPVEAAYSLREAPARATSDHDGGRGASVALRLARGGEVREVEAGPFGGRGSRLGAS